MASNRSQERRRSYALSNAIIAWCAVHASVLAWQQDEQILNGAGEILAVADDITAEWLALPRPRPYGLREHVRRYINAVADALEDDPSARWRAHLARVPARRPLAPSPDAPRRVGRISAYALVAAGAGGPYTLTRNLAGRYGGHTVAALSDAGLIEPGDTPLTLRLTELGRDVRDLLVANDVTASGCDIERWRGQVRDAVARLLSRS